MSVEPFAQEDHTRESARARLKGLGARLTQQGDDTQIYFSKAADTWIGAEPTDDGGVLLSFFDDCPCAG